MNTDIGSPAHLDDAEIIRLLDGDDPTGSARSASHVRSCSHCADQLAALRADAATVRAWLDRAAFEEAVLHAPRVVSEPRAPRPLRPRRTGAASPWLRAAAVLLLLAAPVAAVPALRQLLVDAVADLRGNDRSVSEPVTATTAAGTTVRFVPDVSRFELRFDEPQPTGTLRVRYGTTDEAVLRIVGDVGEGPVVSAQAVQVRNSPGSAGSYVLEVPHAVTSLRIQIGDRAPYVVDAAELRTGVELPVR